MGNNKLVQDYLSKSSWRIKENSNTTYSYSGIKYHIDSNVLANYALSQLPKEIRTAHQNGDFHIHNLESGNLIPYCAGCSLMDLLLKGLFTPSITSRPARHFSSVSDHVMNYLYMRQMETAGAVAFNDVDTLLAPFIRFDHLNRNQVKQDLQRLIFNLNFTLRSSSQTPFSNFSLNFGVPKYMEDEAVIHGGELQKDTYKDFIDEIQLFDELFIEILKEKDASGRPFPFPIPTINLTNRFNWSNKVSDSLFEEITELGSFYFMNYIGSGISEDTVRSMCCRLSLNLKDLSESHGLWNNGDSTGSLGVVTINMGRLGYLCKTEEQLYKQLSFLMDLAKNELIIKENTIREQLANNLMPFSKYYNLNLDHYFRTIGEVGINEMCLNFTGKDITQNIPFVFQILNFMRNKIREYQIETKKLFNIEMTPAEGCSYRLALIDRKKYPKITTLGNGVPYYSSLLIPPSLEIDVLKRMELEQDLLPLFNGGTIFRTFIGENVSNPKTIKDFVKMVSTSKIPYYDVTTTFSICKGEGKSIRGIHHKCPDCGSETEVYSRVVGYYREIKKWNPGKIEEFNDRKYIDLNVNL